MESAYVAIIVVSYAVIAFPIWVFVVRAKGNNSNRKPAPPESPTSPLLKPGVCECGHMRCVHNNGNGKCHVGYPHSEEWPNGSWCACTIFIEDPDSDDDTDEEDEPDVPTPEALEKLYSR